MSVLVVAGPNGCGKSSFFESILFALGREDLLLRHLDSEHQKAWLRTAMSADFKIRLLLDVLEAAGTEFAVSAPCRIQIERSSHHWTVGVEGEPTPLLSDPDRVRSLLLEVPIQWFSSRRQSYLPGPLHPMADLPASVRGEEVRLWNLKRTLIDECVRAFFRRSPGREVAWLESISRAWSKIHDQEAGERLVVAGDDLDPDHSRFDLYLEHDHPELGKAILCSVDQFSAGELDWLSVVGSLVVEGFDGFVFIDEPELHLHPLWQQRVVPLLVTLFPECSFVISTHSPFLMRSLDGRDSAILRLPDGRRFSRDFRAWSIDDILLSVFDISSPWGREIMAQLLQLEEASADPDRFDEAVALYGSLSRRDDHLGARCRKIVSLFGTEEVVRETMKTPIPQMEGAVAEEAVAEGAVAEEAVAEEAVAEEAVAEEAVAPDEEAGGPATSPSKER